MPNKNLNFINKIPSFTQFYRGVRVFLKVVFPTNFFSFPFPFFRFPKNNSATLLNGTTIINGHLKKCEYFTTRLVYVFKNWKLLFKNIYKNTYRWKNVWKYVKCYLKTKNDCLKIQTKHPLCDFLVRGKKWLFENTN